MAVHMLDTRRSYLIESVVHAAHVLEAFASTGEVLRLRDVVTRTGLGKARCFRLLHTLHYCGLVDKVDVSRYRLACEVKRRRQCRIGYAAQGAVSSFGDQVRIGLQAAAEQSNIELIVVDNRYQPKVALRNAQHLVRENVDLVVEFQTDEAIAPAIAAYYLEAGIPYIAIDIPHPGATYFGANNYEAGLLAGRYLGRWARTRWQGNVDEIVLLALERAGSLVRARVSGIQAGLKETVPEVVDRGVTVIDGDGQFKVALEQVRRHLRQSKARYVLVGAANDVSALGAARAFQEAGRDPTCAIVGQNAEPDARAELRDPRSPLVGSAGYFPERYGEGLIRLALDILAKKPLPPAIFVRHQMVTRENVDHLYPNDGLLGVRPSF
jgi:ribose transport system substrate-binding protein